MTQVVVTVLRLGVILGTSPVLTVDVAATKVTVKGSKKTLNMVLRLARIKPSMMVTRVIIGHAMLPIAGVGPSPSLGCGILISKRLG